MYIYIYKNLDKCIQDREYAEDFNKAEVCLQYKNSRKEKSNYRPVGILLNVLKVYDF